MEQYILSGTVVWVILAVMVVEAVVLARLIKSYPGILAGLGAGGFMVLALGAALSNAGAYAIAACLATSFVFHAIEVFYWFRLRRGKVSS